MPLAPSSFFFFFFKENGFSAEQEIETQRLKMAEYFYYFKRKTWICLKGVMLQGLALYKIGSTHLRIVYRGIILGSSGGVRSIKRDHKHTWGDWHV